MNGGSIKKKIRQELTYRDLDSIPFLTLVSRMLMVFRRYDVNPLSIAAVSFSSNALQKFSSFCVSFVDSVSNHSCICSSNIHCISAESGDGYSDISVEVEDRDIGIVIDVGCMIPAIIFARVDLPPPFGPVIAVKRSSIFRSI